MRTTCTWCRLRTFYLCERAKESSSVSTSKCHRCEDEGDEIAVAALLKHSSDEARSEFRLIIESRTTQIRKLLLYKKSFSRLLFN